MIHDSELFNFQEIIASIRKDAENSVAEDPETPSCLPILDTITEDTELEDLPFYKEWLSKFDVEHDLEDLELACDPILEDFSDDFLLLLKFVAASFSNTYSLDYDADTNKVILSIKVENEEMSVVEKLDTLVPVQIFQMFKIYLNEQLSFASLGEEDEEEREAIEEERNYTMEFYRDAIKNLKFQIEKAN